MPPKYIGSIQQKPIGSPKRERGRNKKITCLYLESNQSMKLTREIGHISTDTLDQDHKLHTK